MAEPYRNSMRSMWFHEHTNWEHPNHRMSTKASEPQNLNPNTVTLPQPIIEVMRNQ